MCGQFSETIHKTSIQPVTKFTYLRELLCDKTKRAIEALPFTAEGYNKAFSILQDTFGKESEIVKTYVKEILDLPYKASSDPKRIHDFYEKLIPPKIVKQIREGLYVDDLITGGSTVPQTQIVKDKAVEVFADAVFTIHKWHSNSSELEPDGESQAESSDLTYAKD